MQHISVLTGATEFKGNCVITLPEKTLDGRQIAVFIDEKIGGSFVVHDGGKTVAELFSQGVSITDSKLSELALMAQRYGVSFANDIFQVLCDHSNIQQAILSVGQCASLGMLEILRHMPHFEEEPVSTKINRSLNKWKPAYVENISRNYPAKGNTFQHTFDFVAFPSEQRPTIALQVLNPGDNARARAERYGFLALDIKGTQFDGWQRVAVVTKAQAWSKSLTGLVKQLSSSTIFLDTGKEFEIEEILPTTMTELMAA